MAATGHTRHTATAAPTRPGFAATAHQKSSPRNSVHAAQWEGCAKVAYSRHGYCRSHHHNYRLSGSPTTTVARIVTDATRTAHGWEFVVDATSSPSILTVTVSVDGTTHALAVTARPHCQETR